MPDQPPNERDVPLGQRLFDNPFLLLVAGILVAAVQGRYYQAGADATRTEQVLQHARELRQRQRGDLERVKTEYAESSLLVGRDQAQLAELTQSLERAEPDLVASQAREAAARDALVSADAAMMAWQQRWESFSSQTAEVTRAAGRATRAAAAQRARC